MRLLHAADLHLDSAYGHSHTENHPDQRAAEQRQVLTQLVDLTLALQPDALMIAGDLLHVPYLTPETMRHVEQQFNRLKSTPVLIAPGNHDPYPEYRALAMPDHVRVFSHRWAPADLGSGVVWGYGHWDAEEPASVIARLRVRDRRRVNVVLFHGSVQGVQSRHSQFAPYTLRELEETGADYFAFGHYHQAYRVEQADGKLLGCYPGAVRGLSSGRRGNRGVVLATVAKRRTSLDTYIGTPEGFLASPVSFEGTEAVLPDAK